MKNKINFTNKKPAATPNFCKRNFSWMHHIDFIHVLCQCPFLCLELGQHTYGADQAEQHNRHRRQNIDKINMVHPRKISRAESWGSSRFFTS